MTLSKFSVFYFARGWDGNGKYSVGSFETYDAAVDAAQESAKTKNGDYCYFVKKGDTLVACLTPLELQEVFPFPE